MNRIIVTGDGSHTLYVPELNEHYHSTFGAVRESNLIFIKAGFDNCRVNPVNILEVGFGTGLNTLLTAAKSIAEKREVNYTTIEKYPLDGSLIASLNHYLYAGESGRELSLLIHSASWNTRVTISQYFHLLKINGDITDISLSESYDLVYFDAFGPDKQPEMWTSEILSYIGSVTKNGGALVTFSAKGEVKRKLKACGFDVLLLPGPPGKRQIIRAVKK